MIANSNAHRNGHKGRKGRSEFDEGCGEQLRKIAFKPFIQFFLFTSAAKAEPFAAFAGGLKASSTLT